MIASAGGWAGMPNEFAVYHPKIRPTGKAAEGEPSSLAFKPPPSDYDKNGLFSVTMYGSDALSPPRVTPKTMVLRMCRPTSFEEILASIEDLGRDDLKIEPLED